MVLKVEQERVHTLLRDTITLLCRNGLSFKSQFSVEALIGITLDQDDVFLVNINEIIRNEKHRNDGNRELGDSEAGKSSDDNSDSDGTCTNRKRRRRKRKLDIKIEDGSKSDEESNNGYERLEDEEESLPNKSESLNNCGRIPSSTTSGNNPVLKQDRDDDSMEDIIIIKEEVQEDWPQFCQSNTFPSTSATDRANVSDPTQQGQSFGSPSSTFTSQDGSFDWSQGMSSQAIQQYQANMGMAPTDPNQQMRHDPYICKICGRSSSTKNNLLQHLRRHQGRYAYTCNVCSKGFATSGDLRGHMSYHTGVLEFKCEFCEKEFRYVRSLMKHKRMKHSL